MAYQINKTDGTVVATVADGQIDTLSTDLTLIGKNYSGFGEALNENFIKLLENFASTTRPNQPVRGQIWFDVSELKLKVYSGTEFLPVSSATIASIQPSTLGVGDLWFNSVDSQLYFYDGATPILLGPAYSTSQGLSGLKVASILDTLNQTRVVTYLYNNGILLGIFAKDAFTPKQAINGFTGSIIPGFNAGNLADLKFNVTCTNSEALGGAVATTYVRKDTSNSIDGQIRITSDLGLVVGSAGQGNFIVTSGNVFISNSATDKDIGLNVRKGINQENALLVSASTRTVSIYDGFAGSQVNIGGSLTVAGDLTVQGTTTTVNSTVLEVTDSNIVLANGSTSDAEAHLGGLILKGSTDHIWMWAEVDEAATVDRPRLKSMAWNSSDSINLAQGKYLAIDNIPIIEQTGFVLGSETFTLSDRVTSIPGVTSFGTQEYIEVGPVLTPGSPPTARIRIEDHTISTVAGNFDIILDPDGTGNIVLNTTARIRLLADPVDQQDAATKEYVDQVAETRPIVLSMDLSDGKPNSYIITNILDNIAPPSEYRDGTYARILCTQLNNSSVTVDINALLSTPTSSFLTSLAPTSAPAVTSVSSAPASVPGQTISTTREVREFQLLVGAWTYVRTIPLPP